MIEIELFARKKKPGRAGEMGRVSSLLLFASSFLV